MRIRPNFVLAVTLFLIVSACRPGDEAAILSGPPESGVLRTEAVTEGVTVVRNTVRQALAAGEIAALGIDERLVAEGNGRATLQRDGLLTVEVLQPGELILESFAEEQFTELTLRQPTGTIFYSFNLDKSVDHRLTVATQFATITSTGARFVVVQAGDKLEWVVNLGQAPQVVEVTAGGATETIPSGTARWLRFDQPPGEGRSVEIEPLEAWLVGLREGQPQPALSDLLFDPADLTGEMASLTRLPAIGQPFAVGDGAQGPVIVTLEPEGLFGRPTYALEDCDGNGSQEISVIAGQVRFDFSEVLAQTQALDVTVINRDLPGNGALWGLNAGQDELGRELLNGGQDTLQTLSLRTGESLQTAQLALVDGCLVGLSLTPPTAAGGPAPPRPITGAARLSGVVVNLLATPESEATEAETETAAATPLPGQAREGEPLVAVAMGQAAGSIQIDGDPADWPGGGWTRFERVVYDDGCANRFPGQEALVDLSGQVRFAYDADFLYVAFQIEDDGYVGYSGGSQEYFLGDSPQLSLDVDLLGDYTEPNRNDDDWQVDFWPEPATPQAVLWQLGSLSVRPFEEARLASRFEGANYFLEAALPWRSFGVAAPAPGERIGLAANVNDNDTPETNVQECIISTSPQREWNNPTTWGILILQPTTE